MTDSTPSDIVEENPQVSSMKKEKYALCINADRVDNCLQNYADDYKPTNRLTRMLHDALYDDCLTLEPRSRVETDFSKLQILPYVVVRDESTGKVFAYHRPPTGDESHLHGKLSIGLGGHIDSLPASVHTNLAEHIGKEAARELDEEVGILSSQIDIGSMVETQFFAGDILVMRMHTSPVEEVHLGLVFEVTVPDASYLTKINPEEVEAYHWYSAQELADMAEASDCNMEAWTKAIAQVYSPSRTRLARLI